MAVRRDLTRAMILFSDLLRASGLSITTPAVIDAIRALQFVNIMHRRDVYLALRTVLISCVEDQPTFDRCFDTFWDSGKKDMEEVEELIGITRERRVNEGMPSIEGAREQQTVDGLNASDLDEQSTDEHFEAPGGSSQEMLMQKDFSSFSAEQVDDVLALTMVIAKRLATRLGQRRKPAARNGVIDLRRSLRANLTKGEIIELHCRERRREKVSLILLCDISGSMDLYSQFLLQFVYAIQNAFRRVETFTFATRLTRISEFLRNGSYKQALRHLTEVQDWSGGTRIGEALQEFNQTWAKLADRRTIVIILSDGWDTGDPEILAAEMAILKRRMGRIVWLNPLLGVPSYEPLNRGMAAALKHVDYFAAAHNLNSLRDLAGHLTL